MIVDATITLGNIIDTAVLGVGAIGAIFTIRSSVGNMKNDLVDLKAEMKKVGEVLIKMAITDTRVAALEQDVRDMRHGRGYVINRSEGGINGEYP